MYETFKFNKNTKQDSLLHFHNDDCNNDIANSDIFRLAMQRGNIIEFPW
jgi:hypothetical protein